MVSSKSTGWMLIMGLVGFVVFFISTAIQGDQGGTAGVVAWASTNNDWQTIMPMRMVTVVLMLVFTVGFLNV